MADILTAAVTLLLAVVIVKAQDPQNGTDIEEHVTTSTPLLVPFISPPPNHSNVTWPPFDSETIPSANEPPAALLPTKAPTSVVVNAVNKTVEISSNDTSMVTGQPVIPDHSAVTQSASTSNSEQSTVTLSSFLSSVLSQTAQSPTSSSSTTSSSSSGVATTTASTETFLEKHHHVSIIVFLVVPVCIGCFIFFTVLFGNFCRKKLRLDKLRHQLMPMYTFDPAEGEDWETELLTDPRIQGNQTTNTNVQVSW